MGLRTAEHIQADYEAARAAYQKALEAESYSVGAGAGRSVTRSKSESLLRQMQDLEREYARKTGGGMRIFGVVPSV